MSCGLYVHVPFCRRKCSYCDFFSVAESDEGLRQEYVEAVCAEIAERGGSEEADTVFFGGGTPSMLTPVQVESIMAGLRRGFRVATGAEVSLEANPESVSRGNLAAWLSAGVNRLSIGVQSLDDRLLRTLGRIHSATEAVGAVEAAAEAGFDNLGVDLMFGLPGQDLAGWKGDLKRILAMPVSHLACYELSVEAETPFGRNPPGLPEETAVLAQWDAVLEAAVRAGFVHYEVSNYSRPGRECLHNIKYWRDGEFLGFGAGAWSSQGGVRRGNPRDIGTYLAGRARGFPAAETDSVPEAVKTAEALVLHLRLRDGVDEEEFAERYGAAPGNAFSKALVPHLEAGRLERRNGKLRLTRSGLLVANDVWGDILGVARSGTRMV